MVIKKIRGSLLDIIKTKTSKSADIPDNEPISVTFPTSFGLEILCGKIAPVNP